MTIPELTTSERILLDLKQSPKSGNEMFKKYGAAWNGQRHRMLKAGAIEAFEAVNEDSGDRYARFIETKYRVVGDYIPRRGYADVKKTKPIISKQNLISGFISTEQMANMIGVKPQTIRAAVCREKNYFGIKPVKMPNRFLMWRISDVEKCFNQTVAPNA